MSDLCHALSVCLGRSGSVLSCIDGQVHIGSF